MNVPARCKHNLFGVGQICEMRGQMALYCSKVPSLPLQLFAGDLRLKLPTIQPHAHLWWDPAPWTPGPAAGLAPPQKIRSRTPPQKIRRRSAAARPPRAPPLNRGWLLALPRYAAAHRPESQGGHEVGDRGRARGAEQPAAGSAASTGSRAASASASASADGSCTAAAGAGAETGAGTDTREDAGGGRGGRMAGETQRWADRDG